jgi:SAM-dependent methyltransferase
MTPPESWPSATFDRLYAADVDPWAFETSAYERAKYATSLAVLRGRRYPNALEVGCSIGVFTAMLAPRCGTLLALDFAEAAVSAARERCWRPGVQIERRQIPDQWPDGRFDLIVLSEVLYFLNAGDIARTARHARRSVRPDGVVLLVNWIGPTDTPCTGDAAARIFTRSSHLRPLRHVRRPGYRLDLLGI